MIFLPYIQIILGVVLGALVLIQHSESGLGSAFGSDSLGASAHTRRGVELYIFRSTIIVAVLFVLSALLNLLY